MAKIFKINDNWQSLQDFFNICDFISRDERDELLLLHYDIEHCYKLLSIAKSYDETLYIERILPQLITARDNLYITLVDKYKLKGKVVEFSYYK